MTRLTAMSVALMTVLLSGCESLGTAAQNKTVQGSALGGALGAATGAIIGNQMDHHAGAGTAIGAGLGAIGGGLMGNALQDRAQEVQTQAAPVATVRMKFCPVGGELYGEDIKYCPRHGVELQDKE